jgi:putative two-component system protein, hydrogenase maturation factor HypX/HoxX
MRVLLLTTAHNSLSQRAEIELRERGHEVSVELALSDDVMLEAVTLFRPHLIVAPFLKRAIPEAIWRRHLCIIVHPGIEGDRGPSSLDWAILEARPVWGVTLLQAIAELDAGAVWASHTFDAPPRALSKSSLYRGPVLETAMRCLLEVVERVARLGPLPLAGAERSRAIAGES